MIKILILLAALQTAQAELERLDEWGKTQPDSGPGRLGVGDEYYRIGKKFPKDRAKFMEKANDWWASAWPLLDPFWKDKARENLRKMYSAGSSSRALGSGEWKGGPALVSGERVHSGMAAACLKMPKGNEGNYHQPLKWDSALPAGVQEVVVTAWVLTDGTNTVNDDLKPTLAGPNGELVYAMGTPIPMDLPIWKKLEIKVPAKGAVRMNLIFEFQSRTGVCFVDDVSVLADGKELMHNGGFEK